MSGTRYTEEFKVEADKQVTKRGPPDMTPVADVPVESFAVKHVQQKRPASVLPQKAAVEPQQDKFSPYMLKKACVQVMSNTVPDKGELQGAEMYAISWHQVEMYVKDVDWTALTHSIIDFCGRNRSAGFHTHEHGGHPLALRCQQCESITRDALR